MTLILAKILGSYFFAIGLAIIINPERFKKLLFQIMKDENFLFLGAIIALFIGAFIVSVHNEWSLQWPVIITVLGWWSLIKGFGLLVSGDFAKSFTFILQKPSPFYRILGALYLVLGVFLIYRGWQF